MSPRVLIASLFVTSLAAVASQACSSDDTSSVGSSSDAAAPDARSRDGASSADGAAIEDPKDAGKDASKVDDASTCKLVKPYSSKDVTCNACAQRECCAAVNGCFSEAECDDGYVNCILACALLPDDAGPDASADAGIDACKAVCAKDYPNGKTAFDTAIGCVDTACATECGGS